MKYKEKAFKFKERAFEAQGLAFVNGFWTPMEGRPVGSQKWRGRTELTAYLESFGGRIKKDKRRRKGYLVSVLQNDFVAEVPMDFAEKVLAFGFP